MNGIVEGINRGTRDIVAGMSQIKPDVDGLSNAYINIVTHVRGNGGMDYALRALGSDGYETLKLAVMGMNRYGNEFVRDNPAHKALNDEISTENRNALEHATLMGRPAPMPLR